MWSPVCVCMAASELACACSRRCVCMHGRGRLSRTDRDGREHGYVGSGLNGSAAKVEHACRAPIAMSGSFFSRAIVSAFRCAAWWLQQRRAMLHATPGRMPQRLVRRMLHCFVLERPAASGGWQLALLRSAWRIVPARSRTHACRAFRGA